MARLFIASYLANENLESVSQFQDLNCQFLEKQINRRVRKVKAESLHLTWLFLGEVQDKRIESLKEALSKGLEKNAFSRNDLSLTYDLFEFWPNQKRPRVGVIRASAAPDAILEVRNTIYSSSKGFCSKESKRKFKPHITIYRIGDRKLDSINSDFQKLELEESWQSVNHKIDSINLVKSDLSQGAPVYTSLLSIPSKNS